MSHSNSTSSPRRWVWFHRFGSPAWIFGFATRWAPVFGWIALILSTIGLYFGLVVAPPDYQMGDSYRIIYIHVPSAWLSMFSYACMAISAGIGLVWHLKVADLTARAIAPLGAMFTFCDGSTRFLSETIDYKVLLKLAYIHDGLPVETP